jgi:hypothetical protein
MLNVRTRQFADLILLCGISVCSVSLWFYRKLSHHRDTENTEAAQRLLFRLVVAVGCFKISRCTAQLR